MTGRRMIVDGNEAVADVAFRLNEVCAIYPITPSSTMAEWADEWAGQGRTNLWGAIPDVVEMQSEGGAAGALHGSLLGGALTTTFTASQGLLLMVPNMFKIAGELTPTVFHVAARSLATNSLSIFGDHQDVMAVRQTGFAMLSSASVQEAHDMAAIAQAATLESRIPFLHFFDGFRTSHEVNVVERIEDDVLRELVTEESILAHRRRAMNPDHPTVRGTASNPDTCFQSREAGNPFQAAAAGVLADVMKRFGRLTGRRYRLFEYHGAPDADQVIVVMGSAAQTVRSVVDSLNQAGGRVGMIQVRLYRPFDAAALLQAIPLSVRRVAVLDRTKEPGALGEPLFADLVLALAQSGRPMPLVIGGRYGLSSKEFTPAMVQAVFRELDRPEPMPRFTVGIDDDVSRLSLTVGPEETEHPDVFRAVFYGLGADGTVGANKNTIKILGESPEIFAQGYFVYDSKKSGSTTVSHVRFGPKPIEAPYLIKQAQFVGVHQFGFVQKMDVLSVAAPGGVVLLSSPHGPEATWSRLPQTVRDQIRRKGLRLFVIDAHRVAREARLAGRTNMVMLTCFFAISGVLPREQAVERIKAFAAKTYARKGAEVVAKNHEAIDATLAALAEVAIPERDSQKGEPMILPLAPGAPTELQRLLGAMIAGEGDSLPVSALPPDGVFPSGTSRWEKRNIAEEIPIWDEASCIQCGRCTFVCPHAAVRPKLFHQSHLGRAPEGVRSAPIDARGFPETRFLLQIFGEDCTGCGLCVQTCPVRNEDGTRALNMAEKEPGLAACQGSQAFFDSLPVNDRASVDFSTVRGAQFLEPTFEFSGACAGCGETPYLRLVSQLFGDRMLVANATGCSSIFGGNLPTTPWSKNHEGRGPAWANSLFEDNAEFGLGMRLAADRHLTEAQALLVDLKDSLGAELVEEILAAPQALESDIRRQRERVARLVSRLQVMDRPDARRLLSIADHLTRRSVWIVGGDGWAYDIGSGGLDHVLAGGRDVNILVLDTEVYSNTGGQASKSTPLGAVARFAHAGKQVNKKDLALQAVSYGNVYVARIALGADPQQTLQALREAEAYPGTSLVIAYSPCIAHGIDMVESLDQQQRAVASGYWPLMRFNPVLREQGRAAFLLDSARPTIGFRDYADRELRYRLLHHTNPSQADELMEMAALAVKKRWRVYEQMAGVE